MERTGRLWTTALCCAGFSGCLPEKTTPPEEGSVHGPTLVVMIVIDQLRPDMLDRFDDYFTGGLRRVIDQGHSFTNATHDHAYTFTAPGHTTLATGVHPARHGIVSNDWWELRGAEWHEVYSMEDSSTAILGYPGMPGRSPANLYRQGLADWVVAADPEARVVSISRKDRAAIGLAARAVGEVYWMSDPVAGFMTSEYYHSEYPAWVTRFNKEEMPQIYGETVWESRVPKDAEHLTRPDTSDHEMRGRLGVFPYRAADQVNMADSAALNRWHSRTPAPDAAVLGLTKAALAELQLGRRGTVDYLAVSLSQTDRIGHNYGPFSREQFNNLLHLDDVLAELFQSLDRAVGPDGWVAAFSSDHGILEIPEHLAESGADAVRLSPDQMARFNGAVMGVVEGGARGDALAQGIKKSLEELPFVAKAYTFTEVENAQARPDSFAVLFAHSLSRERALSLPSRYGVYHRWRPQYFSTNDATTHGTPYFYDRTVPLIFLGAGVEAGMSDGAVATVDVAPTLAALAGIQTPDDLDGRVLLNTPPR